MAQFKFGAIGTSWTIDIYRELDPAAEAALLVRIQSRIDAFDQAYSRFREDSLVTAISKKAGTYELPDDAELLLSLYHDLYKKTDGLVTPLIGNLISDAGYDAKYSLKTKEGLESPPEWDEAIEYRPAEQGHPPILIVKKPVLLDFGAAGKGYLIDIVAGVLEADEIHGYCINAGGDILHKNKEPLRVGLEDPEDAEKVIGACVLPGDGVANSIAGSAGNRRKWGKFTHIINPHTMSSPKDIIAVWVVAETALLADAMATCLFFVPAKRIIDAYDFEYVIVRKDRSLEKSAHFPGEIFVV